MKPNNGQVLYIDCSEEYKYIPLWQETSVMTLISTEIVDDCCRNGHKQVENVDTEDGHLHSQVYLTII